MVPKSGYLFLDGQPRVSLAGHLFYPESEPKQLIKSRGVEVSLKAWTKSKKKVQDFRLISRVAYFSPRGWRSWTPPPFLPLVFVRKMARVRPVQLLPPPPSLPPPTPLALRDAMSAVGARELLPVQIK